MTLLTALLPDETDRAAFLSALGDDAGYEIGWAESWRALFDAVRNRPADAAVVHARAEPRKDGTRRIRRFVERFPHTPILVCGGRERFAAPAAIAVAGEDASLRGRVRAAVEPPELVRLLAGPVRRRLGPEARDLVCAAARRVHEDVGVADLAQARDVSVSTVERRHAARGLPTPGRLLLWLRVLRGLLWLREPGRSVESVARQLSYSSGAAFRRAIHTTVGGPPGPLRDRSGPRRALRAFLAECPGAAESRTGAAPSVAGTRPFAAGYNDAARRGP